MERQKSSEAYYADCSKSNRRVHEKCVESGSTSGSVIRNIKAVASVVSNKSGGSTTSRKSGGKKAASRERGATNSGASSSGGNRRAPIVKTTVKKLAKNTDPSVYHNIN